MTDHLSCRVSLRAFFEQHIAPHAGGHLTMDQVRADIVQGRLPAVRIRGRWHVDPADAPAYLARTIRLNTPAAA